MELTLRIVGFLATCVGILLTGVELRQGHSANAVRILTGILCFAMGICILIFLPHLPR